MVLTLPKLLLRREYEVWGTSRDAEMVSFHNLERRGILNQINTVSLNLRDSAQTFRLIQQLRPGEVYNLAAHSSVGLSFEQPVETIEHHSRSGQSSGGNSPYRC